MRSLGSSWSSGANTASENPRTASALPIDNSRDTVSPSRAVTMRPSRALTGSNDRACMAESAKPSNPTDAPTPVRSPGAWVVRFSVSRAGGHRGEFLVDLHRGLQLVVFLPGDDVEHPLRDGDERRLVGDRQQRHLTSLRSDSQRFGAVLIGQPVT